MPGARLPGRLRTQLGIAVGTLECLKVTAMSLPKSGCLAASCFHPTAEPRQTICPVSDQKAVSLLGVQAVTLHPNRTPEPPSV